MNRKAYPLFRGKIVSQWGCWTNCGWSRDHSRARFYRSEGDAQQTVANMRKLGHACRVVKLQ